MTKYFGYQLGCILFVGICVLVMYSSDVLLQSADSRKEILLRESGACRDSNDTLPAELLTIASDLDRDSVKLAGSKIEFTRAVLVYYPVGSEDEAHYYWELKWLHRTWMEMLKTQPANWRTDLIAVMSKPSSGPCQEAELNCTVTGRKTPDEASVCRCLGGYNPNMTDFEDYNVANSLNILTWANASLEQYDWILRTDIDVFLTPAFSKWRPRHMTVGRGGYIFTDAGLLTTHRLRKVAQILGLNYKELNNIGSSWYGPTRLLQRAAEISIEAMRYMKKYEFTKLERSTAFRPQGWPEWHYGVLSMYGAHLAINHLSTAYKVVKDGENLDYGTTVDEPVAEHAHLHAWQSDVAFSKYQYYQGNYNNITYDNLNITTCKNYAMFMALDVVHRRHT